MTIQELCEENLCISWPQNKVKVTVLNLSDKVKNLDLLKAMCSKQKLGSVMGKMNQALQYSTELYASWAFVVFAQMYQPQYDLGRNFSEWLKRDSIHFQCQCQ
jgi:hypothetical protein